MPIHCKKDLDILVTITDSSGRKFDNFSSLVIDWSVSSPQLADLKYNRELRADVELEANGKKMLSSEQKLCLLELIRKEKRRQIEIGRGENS